MSSEEENPAVVVDAGSGTIRIGYAGEDGPRASFVNLWGQVKDDTEPPVPSQLTYVGPEAQEVSTTYITCLLYTSPSPRDQRGSRMPSSA